MNFSKFHDFYQRDILTDCHLVLQDDKNNKIKMNIHKIVLCTGLRRIFRKNVYRWKFFRERTK